MSESVFDVEDRFMANVYQKRRIAILRGRGATVWDINGKEYIDCTGSYGVSILGHSHPRVVSAVKAQAEKLISCHGSLYNDARAKLLSKLVEIVPKGLNKIFLCNSGAEAVECAIKIARKYTGRPEIIAMMGAFHGKTFGALSATWDSKYRKPFEPLVPGFKFVPFGKIDRLIDAISPQTAAVIVEPIQGEGGVRMPPNGYLREVRKLCDEREVLLILDEVQTGFGRTGKMFCCEHWNVVPDIMCLAKGLGGGIPIGATVSKEDIMSTLKIGEHSSTFGGNPLACAAAYAVIETLQEEDIVGRAAELGRYFKENLLKLREKCKVVRDVRGMGLMLALESRFDVYDVILKAAEMGVLLLDAGRNVLRFLPPLVIEKWQIDRAVEVVKTLLEEEENERLSS
jgi:acetylornithine/LysW-gamma-L-lysine aminotransferase